MIVLPKIRDKVDWNIEHNLQLYFYFSYRLPSWRIGFLLQVTWYPEAGCAYTTMETDTIDF